jgi:hypothetical protein
MRAKGAEASAGDCRTGAQRSCAVVVEEMGMKSPRRTHLESGTGIRLPRHRPRT